MGLEKNAAKVIDQLWARIAAHDWAKLGELLAPELVVEWPVSAERIEGPRNFVAVNSEYPEGWSIRVLRIVPAPDGETVVSEVEVPHEELGDFRAVSFWTVRDGLVVAAREYWTSTGADPVPEWRTPYTSRVAPE
ncbi:hypothetical protein BIV57_06870 [Mangrovactinospora gilvigrisea]|uniref:SnoaL-like domain-containing protein n=1 Tax=Mangrovactinospora gilvigrisea TaxID=1428644 RepID=A0A1J7BHS9_9ACTN|nr:nuclear transport factor 2 family protein [Mangrovactinospora gilvigrisea]OIV38251.1 hypothetical protein BIV57_06870 [Mangrovactinospora gilvigrisea]